MAEDFDPPSAGVSLATRITLGVSKKKPGAWPGSWSNRKFCQSASIAMAMRAMAC